MKIYKQDYTKKILVYVLLWFLMTGYSYQASAKEPSGETIRTIPYEEMPIILDLIASQIRDNYERIITWSGEIDVKINWLDTGATAKEMFKFTDGIGEIPEAILQKVEEKIAFAIDAKKNFVYVDKFREKNQYLNGTTGIDLGRRSTGPICSTLIYRPDFLLEAQPYSFDIKDHKVIHSKAFKKPSKQDPSTGFYIGFSDPRKTFVPGGVYIWDRHDDFIKHINKFGNIEFDGYKFQMEERIKGDIIEYKTIQPAVISLERSDPNHYIIQTKIFSSRYSFNMIYWEIASGGGIPFQKFTYEYELVNDAYLPKRIVEKHYRLNRQVAQEKDCTYINNKLNQKIPSETFEYVNLNLKEGDIFIDEILNKEYRYKAATQTLEPVEK